MEEKEKKPLYFPTRVNRNNKDFIQGFGGKEVLITVISLIIAIFLFFSIESYMNNVIIPLAIGILVVSGTVVFVRRDITDESLVDKLVFIYKFSFLEQKRYEYEYHDCRFSEIRRFFEIEEED